MTTQHGTNVKITPSSGITTTTGGELVERRVISIVFEDENGQKWRVIFRD